MKQHDTTTHTDINSSFENELSELIREQLLFTETIYARLPIGIEIYDANGVLRSINDHALQMYGVDDRKSVENIVNLFNSPYVDEELEAKIKRGEDIVLEFEYDFAKIKNNAYFSTHNQNTMIYEVKVIAIWGKSGSIIGHILLANDVTDVKEAEFRTEESKKNLEMAMEAANMSSWVYDVNKKVFNPLYGNAIAKVNMAMHEVLDILHPQDKIQLEQLFAQLISRDIQQGQIMLRFYHNEEQQYRHYESRMRLSSEHKGKLLIVGTQLDMYPFGVVPIN